MATDSPAAGADDGESIEQRARFDLIRYANCWEDSDLLAEALQPAPGRRMLSIASAGDNSFVLLARGAEVVAADLSLAQLALVELKAAAVGNLRHGDALAFLGLEPHEERWATFREIRGDLSPTALRYWEQHRETVEGGVVHGGKFEDYFRLFRSRMLPLVHRRKTVESLMAPRERDARLHFYRRRWDTWRWRLLFRVFFSRFLMGRLGRDPEFFRYVEGSVAERILGHTRYALTELSVHDNPYVRYILQGDFRGALPPWLEPERYESLRAGLAGLSLFHGPIQEAAREHSAEGRPFHGFNLSDVFEYLPAQVSEGIYGTLLDSAAPGARLAYWNLLVPRRRPEGLAHRVVSLEEEAKKLFAGDRAFFYSAFVLEEAAP